MSVVAKLRQLSGPSSYTAVADDLVRDAFTRLKRDAQPYNAHEVDKNIRRRVYDTLNVLASMGFVARSGKDVQWKGVAGFMQLVGLHIPQSDDMPSQHGHCGCQASPHTSAVEHSCAVGLVKKQRMENERLRKSIAEKKARIAELRSQQSSLQTIITRNVSRDSARVTTGMDVLVGDSMEYVHPDPKRVTLPFLMISTDANTLVAVEMDDHREEMVFRFDRPFQIHEGFNIVGQVCDQVRGVHQGVQHEIQYGVQSGVQRGVQRNAANPFETLRSKPDAKADSWRKVYDGRERLVTGSSGMAVTVGPCEGATDMPSPKPETLNKRTVPLFFVLQPAGFLR